MDVSIKKVGEPDGVERFVLVNSETRQVLTANEVKEGAIRRFFEQLGATGDLIDSCLDRARQRYSDKDQHASDPGDSDELLFDLGLDED